jgi:hypothetical protein
MSGQLKKEKLTVSSDIDALETLAEVRPLTTHDIELKSQYFANLVGLLRDFEYGILS